LANEALYTRKNSQNSTKSKKLTKKNFGIKKGHNTATNGG